MQFDDVILGRRSIRGYKPDHVPKELIEEIIGLAMRAPSSMNTQPWNFYVVTGEPLPALPAQGPDPAVGMTLPTLAGVGQDGEPMEIGPAGGVQMVVALAHWCPHCQRELPMLVDMIDAGDVPEGVSVVGLSTGITPDLPPAAQVTLMVLMFVGRVGTITVASALALKSRQRHFHLPEERPVIG